MIMPLEGIKVIDLSRLAPGPFCTMVLGDLGAEVVRVEEAGGGRAARTQRAPEEASDASSLRRNAAFNPLKRNKRSIALNLKLEGGQHVLHRMCEDADVFVEGFRPGVVDRLGCDYQTLDRINPRLVYCSISGYGQDGAYRDLVGHDINYISIGGALGVIGPSGGPPAIPYNIIADYAAGGMHAALGIMAALMSRQKTGSGQYVDISMADGVAYLLAPIAAAFFRDGTVPQPGGMPLNGGVPYYNVYQCSDGKYITVGCIEPWFWENLCRALGREDLVPYQFDDERHPEVFACFRDIFKTRSRDEWWDHLRNTGDVAVGKVYSLDEMMDDPQMRHRGTVQNVGHIDGEPVRQVGIGPKLSKTPGAIRSLGSVTGQDTEEVLKETGYSSEEIASLRQQGAVA